MDFRGDGQPITDNGMDTVCETLGVSEPEVWAVISVETRSFGFFQDKRPQILFERHVFSRLTSREYDILNPNISSKRPGGYVGGVYEYTRLEKAMEFNRETALQSASWGVGQVMGFNHKAVGFDSVEEMVWDMVESEDRQLLIVARFIQANGLRGVLRRHNWASFARGYIGKEFKKNEYDARLAAAYAKYKTILPDLALRTAQAGLVYLGFEPGPIDGLRGRRTRSALILFQERYDLPITGELDSETEERLLAEAFPSRDP